MAQIVKATDYNLNICKQALVNSQVIAVPTETVYGIAGNALDKIALKAIFDIKNRPLFNPLIIHTDCIPICHTRYKISYCSLFIRFIREMTNK